MKLEVIEHEIPSILDSIKKKLGGEETYGDAFDHDILVSINSAFATLHQLGIDDRNGNPIRISNSDQKWTDFFDTERYEWIKDYVYMKVRLAFDPPSSSFVLNSMQAQIDEMVWRIEVERDNEINENV